MPVAKHVVEALQIIKRGAGGVQHVAALVAEEVLLERKMPPRAGNKLPHAGGFGAADGLGVEGTFHKRQQRQLGRHATALDFFYHVVKIFVGAPDHALHIVWPAGVVSLFFEHGGVVQIGHGKAAANAIPQIV